jgi:undecaprenyl-diphosphatase
MDYLQAILLAIIEGITEFLPISSTGHMIIASSFMGNADNELVKTYTVAIQFGAILSVIVLYYQKFFNSLQLYLKVTAAFIPSAIIGFLLDDFIDSLLGDVRVVGFSLLLGGILLLFIDKLLKGTNDDELNIPYSSAIKIGLFQCIAMIPGVSRSAATIIGGMSQNLTRKAAAEFSFFLAVPTMFGATVLKMKKAIDNQAFTQDDIGILLVGNLVAFIVAYLAIKSFIRYVSSHSFKVFGYYRIFVGAFILILYYLKFVS